MRRLLPVAAALLAFTTTHAYGASSKACDGGAFTLSLPGIAGIRSGSVSAAAVPSTITVRGRYVEFDIDAATFGISHYVLTGAANRLDITGGVRTPVFDSKTPDHRGLVLNGNITFTVDKDELLMQRTGPGLSMKIQAKDCAQGGIFQMEPERADGTTTDITHRLAVGAFYFNNPRFEPGGFPPLPICVAPNFNTGCYPVPVTRRVNFANDVSRNFVGRDSAQAATKLNQFGLVSTWRVASGGRMGQVMGEDATEVAPPATTCVSNCSAQDQVRGQFPVLGFPFPVPSTARILPLLPN